MRRALIVCVAAVALFALPAVGATAYTHPCGAGTPTLPPYGTSVGIGTSTPTPGTERTLICIYGAYPSDTMELTNTVTTGTFGTSVLVGDTAMFCWPPEPDRHYWCDWAGGGVSVDVTPAGDAWVRPGASACEGRYTWEWPHCVYVLGMTGVDGPAGPTMGAGGAVVVCDEQVAATCVHDLLGIPAGIWIDLTPYRDAIRKPFTVTCGGPLCP